MRPLMQKRHGMKPSLVKRRMQWCRARSCGVFGRAAAGDIARRSNNNAWDRFAYAHGDYVLREIFLRPDPCVVSLGDNIDDCGVDRDIYADVRIKRKEAGDRVFQDKV